MSHVITETPTFDPAITVPDALDPGTLRAEDVEDIAQSLANRTQAMKVVTDVAAVKNAPNTFTAAQTFAAGLTASTAAVTGALTANGGITAADGKVEITANADVSGLLRANGGIGASDGSVEIVNTLVVNAYAFINQPHLYIASDVDIVYPAPGGATDQPQRLVQLDISRAQIAAGTPVYDYSDGCWHNPPAAGIARLEIPILLPRVTLQWSFQVIWASPSGAAANVAEVWRWVRDYAASGYNAQPVGTIEGISISQSSYGTTIGEAAVQSGPVITTTFDPQVERWAVIVKLLDGSNNRFYGLRLQFWDPGARNG